MKVNSLEIYDFRNIKEALFIPHPELTVIAGENGQGKTNLLEAVFLLTGGKSFRASKDLELVQRGELSSRLQGCIDTIDRQDSIAITIFGLGSSKKGRYAKINGVDYGRAATIAGRFTAVVFAPGHLSLVKSGPEGRRRFLDAALCQLYPGYVMILHRYMRALTQKNALLKKFREMADADALLDIFDGEMAEVGAEISRRRAEYLQYTAPAAEEFYGELAKNREKLEISFLPCCGDGDIMALLLRCRSRDLRAGFCTAGPHREDFDALIDGQSARVYGSQGQQRSVVLSLKLAEAQRAKEVSGQHPVMLLDDVLSELDENRQAFLLAGMQGKQNFLTTCDAAPLKQCGGQVVYMENGRLKP